MCSVIQIIVKSQSHGKWDSEQLIAMPFLKEKVGQLLQKDEFLITLLAKVSATLLNEASICLTSNRVVLLFEITTCHAVPPLT